jgi:hypothetical protein
MNQALYAHMNNKRKMKKKEKKDRAPRSTQLTACLWPWPFPAEHLISIHQMRGVAVSFKFLSSSFYQDLVIMPLSSQGLSWA